MAAEHVWDWFLELADRRGHGPLGPLPLTHSEVLAWATLTGRRPRAWELRLLVTLDRCWITETQPPDPKGASSDD